MSGFVPHIGRAEPWGGSLRRAVALARLVAYLERTRRRKEAIVPVLHRALICLCAAVAGAGPAAGATPFELGGQRGWLHDEGHSAGFFHTYDLLRLPPGGTPHKVHIFLPRGYEAGNERFPVVYMNDGQTAFFSHEGKTWDVAGVLSKLRAEHAIDPLIVVAIHPFDRAWEYSHEEGFAGERFGGLRGYADFLAGTLKPWVDSHYRTRSEARSTAIVGSSRGGLAAFYTAAVHSAQFGFAGCLSPSFWVGVDTGSRAGNLQASSLLAQVASGLVRHPRFWIDWGLVRSGGFHNAWIEERATVRGREMRDLLVRDFGYRSGEDIFTTEDPAGEHNEESWRRRLPEVLVAFAGAR